MQNETRRLELANKFKQMGEALLKEGTDKSDFTIAQSGGLMLLMNKLVVNDEDMFIFSELAAMFSAKKILDEEEKTDKVEKEVLLKILEKKKNEARVKKAIDAVRKRRCGRKSKDTDDSETK